MLEQNASGTCCQNSGSYGQSSETPTNQLENYAFTKDQYNQILQMLKKISIPAPSSSAANVDGITKVVLGLMSLKNGL